MLPLDCNRFKQRQGIECDNYPKNLSLRIHQSLAWLQLPESCHKNLDGQFISLRTFINTDYSKAAEYHSSLRQFMNK
jgi:hypothetical protein